MPRVVRFNRRAFAAASLAAAIGVCGIASRASAEPGSPATRPTALVADRVPLDDFLATLRSSVDGLNLAINWPALEAAGIDRTTPITLHVRGLPLRKVLDLALRQAGEQAAWYVDGEVVTITTRDLADRAMVTRVYPVQDLIVEVPNFPGPTVQLSAGSGGRGGGGGSPLFSGANATNTNPGTTSAARGEQLAELIRTLIRPEIWLENGGYASVRFFNGNLIVTAPRDVQAQIGR